MLNSTTTATAVATSTSPVAPSDSGILFAPFEPRDSQSKLREILRDQTRREENHQHPSLATSPSTSTSLQRQGSSNSKSKPKFSPTSSSSAANLSPAKNGHLGTATSSPPSRKDLTLPHNTSPHLVDMYPDSQASFSSQLQRERSLRHTYTEPLGAAPEYGAPSGQMNRSQSTAGLSNGLDLKVVILGAQGECFLHKCSISCGVY
jgi:hypothetical protein